MHSTLPVLFQILGFAVMCVALLTRLSPGLSSLATMAMIGSYAGLQLCAHFAGRIGGVSDAVYLSASAAYFLALAYHAWTTRARKAAALPA